MFKDLFDNYEEVDPDEFDYDDDSAEAEVRRWTEETLRHAQEGLYIRPDVTFMEGWES